MDDFLTQLAEALNQPKAQFKPDQNLADLPNWDSLAILTTLSMIDQEYDVMMSGADLQNCQTIADLYSKVMEAKAGSE